MSAEHVRGTCPPNMSAELVRISQTYPPSLPTLREEGREKEALSAPAPQGAGRTRRSVAEIRDMLTHVLPATARTGIDCSNTDLADAITAAEAAGWTPERIRAALADMTAAKKSPTGQAIARLRDLAGKDPAAIILDQPTAQADGQRDSSKVTPTPRDSDHVLASDTRNPGRDGFGHHDPPNRQTARPAGFDQDVRDRDEAERRRQAAALRKLHTGTQPDRQESE